MYNFTQNKPKDLNQYRSFGGRKKDTGLVLCVLRNWRDTESVDVQSGFPDLGSTSEFV